MIEIEERIDILVIAGIDGGHRRGGRGRDDCWVFGQGSHDDGGTGNKEPSTKERESERR